MNHGEITMNLSTLLEMEKKTEGLRKAIENIMVDREKENAQFHKLSAEVKEMSKIYERDKEIIKQLQDRRCAEDVFEYVDKYHSRLTITRSVKPADFYKEFDAFMKEFLKRKDKEAENDDLPF